MSLTPLPRVVETAVEAAKSVRRSAVDARASASLRAVDMVSLVNGMQARFDRIKPVLVFEPAEVQAAAVALYGSQAPADVLALVAAGQAAGADVVAAILASPISPTATAAHAWDDASGLLLDRAYAGADIAFLAAPLDALIAALEPVGG